MRLQRWVVGDEHRLGVDAEKDDLGLWCQAAQVELLEDELESLRAEVERLTSCLKKANAQAEHFEREWYLRGGEIERLTEPPAALTAEQVAEPGWYRWVHPSGYWEMVKFIETKSQTLDIFSIDGEVLHPFGKFIGPLTPPEV